MPRYVAFLRGVSPMNASMAQLRQCFERIGMTDVKTVLSSGNVLFSDARRSEAAVTKAVAAGMATHLPRTFPVLVRSTAHLRALVAANRFAGAGLAATAKSVITFLSQAPPTAIALPIEQDGARILAVHGREAFTTYVPHARGPVFMALIEKTFGSSVTTRTLETVTRCAEMNG